MSGVGQILPHNVNARIECFDLDYSVEAAQTRLESKQKKVQSGFVKHSWYIREKCEKMLTCLRDALKKLFKKTEFNHFQQIDIFPRVIYTKWF